MLTPATRLIGPLLTVLGFALSCVLAAAAEPLDPQIEAIRAAWQKREESAKTVVMKWSKTEVREQSAIPGEPQIEDKKQPQTYYTHQSENELRLAGIKADWRRSLMTTTPKNQLATLLRGTCDGRTSRQYTQFDPVSSKADPHGSGDVFRDPYESIVIGHSDLFAPLLTFRPLLSGLSRLNSRSQAPAWERLSPKLRFAEPQRTCILHVMTCFRGKSDDGLQKKVGWHAAKQSFADMRSQAGAWDREKFQVSQGVPS